jgi:hypothetical protein
MAVKAKKAAAEAKTEKKAAGKPAKGGKESAPGAKNAKAAEAELTAAPASEEDAEELEEQAAVASSSGGGNAAALAAAAGGSTEMSASFKNFRHHPDMENFYRFIYDNDLRLEALQIIDEVLIEKRRRKELKHAKAQAH